MPAPAPIVVKACGDCGRDFETRYGRWCSDCVWKHKRRSKLKYDWTPERDQILRDRYDSRIKNRALEIATEFGWPKWVITHRALALGLTFSRKELGLINWTPKEELFLHEHTGKRTSFWIGKQLRRSETSVIMKQKKMKLCRRVRVGYTLRDLCLAFGVDHHSVRRWVNNGLLDRETRGTKRKGNRNGDIWLVREEAILRFILQHPTEFELRKVDQTWLLSLLGVGAKDGLLQRAIIARSEGWRKRETPRTPDHEPVAPRAVHQLVRPAERHQDDLEQPQIRALLKIARSLAPADVDELLDTAKLLDSCRKETAAL